MDTKFFKIPFAQSGDLATVPNASQPDGSVSYTDGYGVDYSLDPGSAIFQGSIATTVLTVTFMYLGTLGIGTVVTGPGVTSGTTITSLGTGTGGTGTYNVNHSQTVSSELLTTISDPNALLIERTKANQIYNDITGSVGALQEFDAPQWIDSADNDGSPFAYSNGARVLYTDNQVWISLVNSNTATPGTDPTKWIVFLSNYALLASPAFTGNPTAPTLTCGKNTTRLATTAFVAAGLAPKAPRS